MEEKDGKLSDLIWISKFSILLLFEHRTKFGANSLQNTKTVVILSKIILLFEKNLAWEPKHLNGYLGSQVRER